MRVECRIALLMRARARTCAQAGAALRALRMSPAYAGFTNASCTHVLTPAVRARYIRMFARTHAYG